MRVLTAGLAGFCVATMLGLAGGFLGGHLTPVIAWLALSGGAATSLALLRFLPGGEEPAPRPSLAEWGAVALFALASLRAFGWLVTVTGDEVRVLFVQNLGDLPLHWQYIRYLAHGVPFWPENPLIAGLGLHYPIGVDLFSSLLVTCGMPMIPLFIWMGLIGAGASGWALWKWGRGFALLGLLANGGFQGWLALVSDQPTNEAWKNLFTMVFVTQRGFLYALPVGLLLLESWRRRAQAAVGESEESAPVPWPAEFLLYASLPFFHVHTFLFLSFLLGCWIVLGPAGLRRHAWRLGLLALIPATALILLVTDRFHGASAVRWLPGWMQENKGFLPFWAGEFGLFLPLAAILAILVARRGAPPVDRWFVWPSCLMILLCAFVSFAPWEWDNIKLLMWAYLTILPAMWRWIVAPRPLPVRMALCVGLFAAGLFALLRDLGTPRGYLVAHRWEIDGMNSALRQVPIAARIAAAPAHDHPLVYHGRKLAMAYAGHLVGHGLPWREAERQLTTLMRGDPEWRREAHALKTDYLFWGKREQTLYAEGPQAWRRSSERVAHGKWGALYRLQPAPKAAVPRIWTRSPPPPAR